MLLNQRTAIVSERVVLVPYRSASETLVSWGRGRAGCTALVKLIWVLTNPRLV